MGTLNFTLTNFTSCLPSIQCPEYRYITPHCNLFNKCTNRVVETSLLCLLEKQFDIANSTHLLDAVLLQPQIYFSEHYELSWVGKVT